jgi:hypothetical protein
MPRLTPREVFAAFICMAAILLLIGCESSSNDAASVREKLAVADKSPAPQPTSVPANRAPAGRAIATVNHRPIERRELIDLMMRSRGTAILQQLAMRELVLGELRRLGLTCGTADIEREYQLTLQADQFNGHDPAKLTPARRDELIDNWTRSRGVSREELAVAMQRQACLRKIAEGQIKISDDMLQKEYRRVHGEKVEVRHMQLAAPRFWTPIKEKLDKGEDFTKLVIENSQNTLSRQNGGLLPRFSEHDDPNVPEMFAKVAFSLKPGEVSNPFLVEGSYSVLKLEKRIPADGVKFEEVRETLRRHLASRLTAEKMDQIGEQLFLRAELKIEDPLLRELYENARTTRQITGPPVSEP